MESDKGSTGMQAANIATDTWHEEAQNRRGWYEAHNEGVLSHMKQQKKRQQEERTMECSICLRLLRRAAGKARHKCTSERVKPVHEQRGSCGKCMLWFKSKGGLAVHRYSTSVLQEELESQSNVQSISRTSAQTVVAEDSTH